MDEIGDGPEEDGADREREISERRALGVETASQYVQKLLLPLLGVPGARFEIVPATAGLRSLVYFVAIEGAPGRFVLRCVRGRDNARWLAAAIDIFAVHKVPAPRPVHRDLSFRTYFSLGWSPFVEELVEGRAFSMPAPEAVLTNLADGYARLHSVRSKRWDRPHKPRGDDMIGARAARAEKLAREGMKLAPAELAARMAAILTSLHEWRPDLPSSYSLCHNRVTPLNVIVRPDSASVLIDLERVKFGSHLEELALIQSVLLEGSADAFAIVLATYRGVRPDLDPEADPRGWLWFRRLVGLRRADAAVRAGNLERARRELDAAETVQG
jgi:Ser/Thr protein kinase RdoA (MazF antagonist)